MFPTVPLTLAQEDAPPIPSPTAPAAPGTVETAPNGTPLGPQGDPQASEPGGPPPFIFIILIAFVAMLLFSTTGQRKEKKKRATMLAALKKGDKVQTVGGILGAVVEIRDADVILKIDENANTRIRFTRNAIQSIVNDAED